jgi:glycosyltransferase involved in cell wall biosynthesis
MNKIKYGFVSVLLNCYNSEKYIVECIKSILTQSFCDFELIIVDNNSTDNTSTLIKKFIDPRLKYYKLEHNINLGEARNYGLQKCFGEYLAIIDSDDLWFPDYLNFNVKKLINNKSAHLLYSNYYLVDHSSKVIGRRFYAQQPSGYIFNKLLISSQIIPSATIIRRSADSIIEFDSKFQLVEDFDCYMNILIDKFAIYSSQPLVSYRLHYDQDSNRKLSLYPIEAKIFIEKMIKSYPKILSKHSKEVSYYMAKIEYYKARLHIKSGNYIEAKLILYKISFVSFKFFILYICFSISPNLISFIHKLLGKYH